jgi:LysR family transcriptional regulator for bpeEF and oprC
MDRLKAMQVFIRVVETEGFGKAAETLSLPPSTVTRAIKELESSLGVRLLQRTTRQLSLTANGAAYYNACQRILADIDDMEASFPGKAGAIHGALRVDTPASITRYFILPKIKHFIARHPDVRLSLTTSDQVADLIKTGIDCVIRTGIPADTTSLVIRKIGEFKWVICGSQDYLKQHGCPQYPDDLKSHRRLGYISSRTGRPVDWKFEVEGQSLSMRATDTPLINDTDAYLACGTMGLGLIRAASYVVKPGLEDGSLHEVLPAFHGPSEPISIMYPRNRHLSPNVRAFIDWCIETFPKF